jgi:arylsulfatase A-like enzyme
VESRGSIMNETQNRSGLVFLGLAAGLAGGILLSLFYVFEELLLNVHLEGHAYTLGDFGIISLYHAPLFVLFALASGVIVALSIKKHKPSLGLVGGLAALLISGVMTGDIAHDLLRHNGISSLVSVAGGSLVGAVYVAAGVFVLLLLSGSERFASGTTWAFAIASIVIATLVLKVSAYDERSFFAVAAILRNLAIVAVALALLMGVGWLLRRAVWVTAILLVLVLATALGVFRGSRVEPSGVQADPSSPNVILICIDTLRADRMSLYGYSEKTTPRLDQLARRGTVFEQCISASNWTKPSVASLLTSVEPTVHGVIANESRVPEGILTAAEIFLESGYQTMGVVANHQLNSLFGFGQGFQVYFDPQQTGMNYITLLARSPFRPFLERVGNRMPAFRGSYVGVEAEDVTDQGIELIKASHTPFFLYLHYMDPHSPYNPPAEYDAVFNPEQKRIYSFEMLQKDPSSVPVQGFRELEQRYLGEILYTDAMLGRLFDYLEASGLLNQTVIALTADHGEAFYDHQDYGHGHSLYEEQIHIPLILWGPPIPQGARIDPPVALLDVLPTLLACAGIEVPDELHGQVLTPPLPGETDKHKSRIIYAEKAGEYGAMRSSAWKYIEVWDEAKSSLGSQYHAHKKPVEFYDLNEDPNELVDLSESQSPERLSELSATVNTTRKYLETSAFDQENVEIDSKTMEALKNLGYF